MNEIPCDGDGTVGIVCIKGIPCDVVVGMHTISNQLSASFTFLTTHLCLEKHATQIFIFFLVYPSSPSPIVFFERRSLSLDVYRHNLLHRLSKSSRPVLEALVHKLFFFHLHHAPSRTTKLSPPLCWLSLFASHFLIVHTNLSPSLNHRGISLFEPTHPCSEVESQLRFLVASHPFPFFFV